MVLAACASGTGSGTSATVPRATSTIDPYAVPATIDVAYLNRVFVALEKINGDATRLIVANKRMTPEAAALLHSILTPDEFEVQSEILNDEIDQGLPGTRQNPGDRKTSVDRIVTAAAECVGVEVTRDYNAIRTQAAEPSSWQVTLIRGSGNATGWIYREDLKRGAKFCV